MNMNSEILHVPIEDIIPNRFQPRLTFDDKALTELANSIKQHGIIQPLVLRKLGDKYEIIAGERRYKAAQQAGLMEVPAVIADVDDNTSAEVALVENVQRKDLTAIEEAKSYKNILDKGYLTQEQLAKKMGLSQSAVANKLRLLNLADEVQDALLNEKISERHARALLIVESKEEQKKWLKRIMDERLTVRQLDMELKKEYGNDSGGDSPVMDINPDIESIKNNATDINIEVPTKPFEKTDFEPEIPKMANKFFNFLEDEAANMNTEPIIEEQKIASVLPYEDNSSSPDNNIEEIETLDDDFSSTSLEPKSEMIPIVEDSEYIDPMSLVETLEPDYVEKQKEEHGLDLKTAINVIRNSINNLNDKGFNIDIEEIDLDNKYNINISIDKE